MIGWKRLTKLSLAASAAIAAVTVFAPVAAAQAQQASANTITIESQDLDSALRAFARQTGAQVLFDPATVAGRRAPAVNAAATPDQALRRLLQGSGLTYRSTGQGTYTILAQATEVRPTRTDTANEEVSEEIVVTAQKREQNVMDVPISITALGAEDLEERRVGSIDDLGSAVPGLAIRSSGSFQRQITLRGVGNTFGNSSLIGLYLDEGSVTVAPYDQLDINAYDLERVEVLRGPQGTLYGEGSVGGTIRFITRDPDLDAFGLRAGLAYSATDDGGIGMRAQGAVNIPLVSDVLGMRVAATFDQQEGWIDQPAAGREDINSVDLADVRLKLLWTPTPDMSWNVMAIAHRNDAPPSTGEDANGDFTQVFGLTTSPEATDDYDLQNLEFRYDLGGVEFLSSTNHIVQDKEEHNLGFRYPLLAPPAAPFEQYMPDRSADAEIWNQEVRLTSTDEGRLHWTIGAYYRDAEINHFRRQFFAAAGPLPATSTTIEDHLQSRSWAIFGDASYEATDRLTLGVGLRQFEEEQQFQDGVNGVFNPMQTGTFDAFTPRVYIQYALTGDANIYASAAEGFRSGGFNQLTQPSYAPEDVVTYEVGTKATFFDGRFSADIAIFYSDYTNYQISGIIPPPGPVTSILSNNGSVESKGVDFAFRWRPDDYWTFSFGGNYVDSRFYEVNVASARFFVGDRVDLVPPYSFTVSAQRDFGFNGEDGFVRLDYSQVGQSVYRNRLRPHYFSYSDVINMLNFNVSVPLGAHSNLNFFGQNLLNDRGYTDPFSIEQNAARARPTTLGVEISVDF